MSTDDRFEPAAESPPQKRGWWSRNWLWAAPVGCLTPVLLCGGCLFAVIGGAMGAMKSSDPFRDSLAAAQASPDVQEALGEPIEAGFLVQGRLNVDSASKLADLNYPVTGPKGSGTVYVSGEADAGGPWVYEEMRVRIDGGPEIDLRPAGGMLNEEAPVEEELIDDMTVDEPENDEPILDPTFSDPEPDEDAF